MKTRGGGKVKGGKFEREVCRALSLWVSEGRHGDLFWRSAMSGGRATVHLRQGETLRQCGDICSVHSDGQVLTDRFFVECKHVRDLQLNAFFIDHAGGPRSMWRYFMTCCQEAERYGKMPLLIAKQNLLPPLVVMRPHHQLGAEGVPWVVSDRLYKVTKLEHLTRLPFSGPRTQLRERVRLDRQGSRA